MNASKKTILIIDDEALVRDLLSDLLRAHNFEVQVAEEGEAGMKILGSAKIDLIITDLLMPGREGIETIHTVRRTSPDVKIIAMSGAEVYLNLAKPFGVDAVLKKPFSNQEVLDLVNRVLA